MTFLRTNAVYITLPFAVIVGVVGYNLENILSDKYTPYSSKQSFITDLKWNNLTTDFDLV